MSLLGHFLGYLFSVLVVCVHFILLIKLFLCSISFKCMQSNIHSRCESLKERLASVLLHDEESDALHKINDYIYKDIEHEYFGC